MNKKTQKIKRVQKMGAKEMIILTCEFNVAITLIMRTNIIKMRKFKKVIMFRMISEKSKKILKSNDF